MHSHGSETDLQPKTGTSPVRHPRTFNTLLAVTFVVLVVLLAVIWGFIPW